MNKERKTRQAKASYAASLFDDLPPAESMEGRGLTKENIGPSPLDRTQCRNVKEEPVGEPTGEPFTARSRGLLGVREAARKDTLASLKCCLASSSKVRAVCGNSARTDLCGGRAAILVPTAI